jgi:hypothetical protein
MPRLEDAIHRLIFGQGMAQRRTQDSPILPEVWEKYFRRGPRAVDLLLNPHRRSSPGTLRRALGEGLRAEDAALEDPAGKERSSQWRFPRARRAQRSMVHNESYVVARLWLDELVRVGLPLTKWWWEYVWREKDRNALERDYRLTAIGPHAQLIEELTQAKHEPKNSRFSQDLLWYLEVIGRYAWEYAPRGDKESLATGSEESEPEAEEVIEWALRYMEGMSFRPPAKPYPLWSVSLNRTATASIWQSTQAVKADAAKRVFDLSCKYLRWGIVDSGIDAIHPAFQNRASVEQDEAIGKQAAAQNQTGQQVVAGLTLPDCLRFSRVAYTYDFTRLRTLLDPESSSDAFVETDNCTRDVRRSMKQMKGRANALKRSLSTGRAIDWDELKPFLEVRHDEQYLVPTSEHGTHVAGILASDWRLSDKTMPPDEDEDLVGMCPDIELYDLRVLDAAGNGSEFTVIAALQFVRHLNAHKDQPVIHGVNLSLSIPHKVDSFACGRTPVCEECERLIGNGVVVVAAAGNLGYTGKLGASLGVAPYQDISITDPGNSESVLTVGSTHRSMPHTYGVSYFSSRGPTGDGRNKPDLLAPGEKIKSTVPEGRAKTLDGTSMAAPHVSGAAALLMARHTELIGQPARVKQILCKTATDLGRERYFQGAGMLDILRAIQSV